MVPTSPAKPKKREAVPQTEARTRWEERVLDRSPVVRRSKDRSVEQARSIVAAALRLIETKGPNFTTQDLIKEAGIALQTFYRYFSGKDSLLLAVIEDVIDENCAAFSEQARELADPIERLHFYVTATVRGLGTPGNRPSFMTLEHFRLQTLYPAEVSRATQPYTDLLVAEIREAMAADRLHPHDPEYSAWLITQLTMAVFHHYDCAGLDEPTAQVAQRVWEFCLAALDGQGQVQVQVPGSPKAGRSTTRTRQGGGSRRT
jgi:AcrR family transcriptional regulator